MTALRLRLHDTLTGKLVPLVPTRPGEVRIYTCGPTTYDVAHIGHARAATAPDVLVRHLRGQGLKVLYVRNVTDVDDKILKRASEQGVQPMELSARMAALYHEDVRAIGCLDPDVEPKVSEHIPDIIGFVQELLDQGAAYEVTMSSGARDIYYSVRDFPGYGKLSKRNIDEMRVGARVEANEDKRDPLDFALWKGCVGDAWGWDSPWGKGRPGWHIECSAMSSRYLGHGFDVHCGGMDLIFPHHENEIAQSEAAFPDQGPFVKVWIHNGFVNVDKDKMSKSLGNFVTIRDVLARNDPEALRYFLLTVHYRGPITFDTAQLPDQRVVFPGILEAERRVDHLYQAVARLMTMSVPTPGGTLPAKMPKDLVSFAKLAADARARVDAALDDDLDTPVALAVLSELAKAANELADTVQRRRRDVELVRAAPLVGAQLLLALHTAAEPLGLLASTPEAYRERTQEQRLSILGVSAEQIEGRLAERTAARQAKDFARADAIRRELDALGVEVADSPQGTTWRVGLCTPPAA